MNRFPLSCALAALLAGSLAAQQIGVFATGWVVTPGSSQTYTPFFFSNGTSQIMGSLLTQCGTSASGGFTLANATFQGSINGGPSVTGGLPTQIDQASDIYSHGSTGGNVTCNLNADADLAASGVFRQGSGYRAVANASVTVACPAYSLTATCRALGVPPPAFPLLMTVPQSGSFTNGGQHFWFVSMDARADTNGIMTGPTAILNMVAACIAYGTVILT